MQPCVLSCQNVSYSYHTKEREVAVISNMSFQVYEGDFVSIVGPSGCGKTTLLSLLFGLLSPEKGKVLFYDQPIHHMSGKHIGYMLQQDHLLEWRTILKNVLLGLEINHMLTPDSYQEAKNLLDTYGLTDFIHSYPSQLSGGMRQRAAFIRTLLLHPSLLLLDEPFSALDYQTRLLVGNDVGNYIKKTNTTAMLVTHDLSEAICLGNRILILGTLPATIKQEMILEFPKELSPLERRDHPLYSVYYHRLWEEFCPYENNSSTL